MFQAAVALAGHRGDLRGGLRREWGRFVTSGVDLWLNTPHRPFEASGTSGMKAAMNGVPSLSILDGSWIEGCVEGSTGWAIGSEDLPETIMASRASLYDKLERDGCAYVLRIAATSISPKSCALPSR